MQLGLTERKNKWFKRAEWLKALRGCMCGLKPNFGLTKLSFEKIALLSVQRRWMPDEGYNSQSYNHNILARIRGKNAANSSSCFKSVIISTVIFIQSAKHIIFSIDSGENIYILKLTFCVTTPTVREGQVCNVMYIMKIAIFINATTDCFLSLRS